VLGSKKRFYNNTAHSKAMVSECLAWIDDNSEGTGARRRTRRQSLNFEGIDRITDEHMNQIRQQARERGRRTVMPTDIPRWVTVGEPVTRLDDDPLENEFDDEIEDEDDI